MIKRLIKRVVVTGVGSMSAHSVVTAFKQRGWLVVGVDAHLHSRHVNQFHLVSRGDQPGFIDELLTLVRRERTTLVIPTRDEDCVAVARRSGAFRRLGAGVYLPDPTTIEEWIGRGGGLSALRTAGIAACDPSEFPEPLGPGARWFEASVCRDVRQSSTAFPCAVHELFADPRGGTVTAERRKGDEEAEDLAVRVARTLNLNGPAAMLLRRVHDGPPAVTRLFPRPCEYAPLTDDVMDALLASWERDQPQ